MEHLYRQASSKQEKEISSDLLDIFTHKMLSTLWDINKNGGAASAKARQFMNTCV